jgi:hypothetical protein
VAGSREKILTWALLKTQLHPAITRVMVFARQAQALAAVVAKSNYLE